jgi:hypothetical protein
MLTVAIGFLTVLSCSVLATFSQGFVAVVSPVGNTAASQSAAISDGIGVWIEIAMISIVAAAAAAEFTVKK